MNKLSVNEIRQAWINFFKSKGHLFVEPKSLIPDNDPSLLWINSGVATLKDYFTGYKNPPCNRITNSQKSIRTNDIVNVGVTARHHTFFEMLGNFSIGDYFKVEAIEFGFELLTKVFKFDLQKLYITVYEDDEVTYNKWIELGIIKSHIIKNGRDRNFWDVGQGPCGPCTEIFFDRGKKYDTNDIGEKLFFEDIENDRYVEIWNIVFSQFNNDGNNNYTELSRKNIDTGAGLERLACVLQETPTNFETDLFLPIINTIEEFSVEKYDVEAYFKNNPFQNEINRCYRVIVDHLKANVFAIADGAIPSNKERGSVLRKLIRRTMLCSKKINFDILKYIDIIINKICDVMIEFYPYLNERKNIVTQTIRNELNLFANTINKGYQLFESQVAKNISTIDGETIFKLVDTYGFPLELIKELASEHNLKIDEQKYLILFEQHQQISKNNIDIKGMKSQSPDLLNFNKLSIFDYDLKYLEKTNIIGIFDENFNLSTTGRNNIWIALDKTIFYATSGGQLYDHGYLTINNIKFEVLNVIKAPNEQHLINIDTDGISINIYDKVEQNINVDYRNAISKNHTAEHILEHVMNNFIDKKIKQEGALKTSTYFTFDFALERKLTDDEIMFINNKVNQIINSSCAINTTTHKYSDIKDSNVVGHFKNVYENIKSDIRLVEIKNINKEICGGTHVKNSIEIEQFLIIDYSTKGAGMWRIKAITSNKCVDNYIIDEVELLRMKIKKIIDEVEELNINDKLLFELIAKIDYKATCENLIYLKKLFNEIQIVANDLIADAIKTKNENEILNIKLIEKELIGNILYFTLKNSNIKNVISALNELSNENKNNAFFVLINYDDKIQYLCVCNKDCNFDCSDIVKKINLLVGGSGGGRKNYAQGGSNIINNEKNLLIYNFLKTV